MGITINKSKCTGCQSCFKICPGNVIRLNDSGKAYLKRPSDCWHCMACIKECKVNAITLTLPPELGGRGGVLSVERKGNLTHWTISRADGTNTVLVTNTREANAY